MSNENPTVLNLATTVTALIVRVALGVAAAYLGVSLALSEQAKPEPDYTVGQVLKIQDRADRAQALADEGKDSLQICTQMLRRCLEAP